MSSAMRPWRAMPSAPGLAELDPVAGAGMYDPGIQRDRKERMTPNPT